MNIATIQREFLELELVLVDEPTLQARSRIDDGPLEELAENIRRCGLQSPMIVARRGKRYEVLAGHRRRLACTLAGLTTAPCIVYPEYVTSLEAIKHGENRFRVDMRPTEEAVYFSELLERDCGGDTDRLADQVGEKRAYVERRLALFQGDPEVFRAADDGRIVIGVAEQLNRCPDVLHRRYLLNLALTNGATVAIAAGWIAEWQSLHGPATARLRDAAGEAPPAPVPVNDAFTCHLCALKEHPASMRPVQMHDYCVHAVLRPALAFWNTRADYLPRAAAVAWPANVDEAAALIDRLIREFPQLVPDDERRI